MTDSSRKIMDELNCSVLVSDQDQALISLFSGVKRDRENLIGLPIEFTVDGVTYKRIPESDDKPGILDLGPLKEQDPKTRLVILYGQDIPASPYLAPAYIHIIGKIADDSPTSSDPNKLRISRQLDIRPNTPEYTRVFNEGARVKIHGFTLFGEAAHMLTTAEVGGNVVYDLQTRSGAASQLTRSRLLAIWHGMAAE